MNATLAGYQAVSILHGGPNTQIRNTAKHLGRYGVSARLFDPWTSFRKEDCDIFHVFAANLGTYHLAREIRTLGVPLVVSPIIYSLHSSRFVRVSLGVTRLLQKFGRGIWSDYVFASDICRWADRVVPNTRAEGELVVQGLGIPSSRISLIPNGVDRKFEHADPGVFRKKFGLNNFILNVGHTGHARKNVLRLIRALATIDYPAVIIGRIIKGPYGDECVREASKYKHIKLVDGLENNSALLASAYAACDVFALPSLFETPGIAALEAGLAGAKVVITRYGGTDEYFGSMATYIDPHSVESIRSGILSALQRPKTDELRKHIRSNFLWKHVAEATAAVYRDVVNERNG
jgi:glycosyltransferase involved in cell wall biosynthesis